MWTRKNAACSGTANLSNRFTQVDTGSALGALGWHLAGLCGAVLWCGRKVSDSHARAREGMRRRGAGWTQGTPTGGNAGSQRYKCTNRFLFDI